MRKRPTRDSSRTIESLTRNLLESYEELDLLYRLAGRLASSLDVQENMELVLDEAIEIFGADLGWVLPAQIGRDLFRLRRKGIDLETLRVLQDRIVCEVLDGGKARVFEGLRSRTDLDGANLPDSLLCTVLKVDRHGFGVLCVGYRETGKGFTAGDLKLANALASSAAVALENQRLNLERRKQEQTEIHRQEEMRLAHEIQAHLLPKAVPELAGYDIAGQSLPARGVGGDYFDLVPIDDHRLAITLGDVCGKGIPAALLMANLQASIRGQTLLRASPAQCLAHTNTLLYESTDPEKFVTCFYGILDAHGNNLWYANAGHERPLVVSADGSHVALNPGGLVLGVLPGETYPEACVAIEPGETLVLFSDGISEAMDEQDHEFGEDRLIQAIAEHREAGAQAILDGILAAVEKHAGAAPVSDDRTLLVVCRDPS